MVVVDRRPLDRCVHQGGRREHAQVVEQGHRLGLVHLRAMGVDQVQQRRHPDPHRGRRADVGVEHIGGNALHRRVHVQHAARRCAVGVHLPAGPRHPRLVGAAADPATDGGAEPHHMRSPDGTGGTDVPGDRGGQARQVVLADDAGGTVRGCADGLLGGSGEVSEAGTEAGWTMGPEPVERRQGQQDVAGGARRGIAPRRGDDHLRAHRPARGHRPPSPCTGQEHHAGGRDQGGRGEPGDTQ